MFWSSPDFKEPLRQKRWYVEFTGFDNFAHYRFALKEASKPSLDIATTEHTLLTHKFKYPGLLTWKPVDLKFVSVIGDANKTLDNVIQQFLKDSGYKLPVIGIKQSYGGDHQKISKGDKQIKIVQVDPDGDDIETWTLYNYLITSVDYGKLVYNSEEFVEISMTVAYDYAFQEDKQTQ